MSEKDDDDIVQLQPAWSIEHRRNRVELAYSGIWTANAVPYSNAIGKRAGWLADVAKGKWAVEDWIVEGLFLPGHIGLLVGDAGTGKSLAALDLMIAAVSGNKWLGHFECLTTPVVYIAGEGKIDENTSHILGLLLGRGEPIGPFLERCWSRIQLHAPDTDSVAAEAPLSSDAWWKNIETLVQSTLPIEARPRLWILDPLLALINSADKADEVRPFIKRVRWLAEQTGGYVLTAHHTKKEQGNQLSRAARIRGESMLRNLFDDVLYLEQDTEDSRLAHLYANKLKRGQTDDTKPMCHIVRAFNPIDDLTFRNVLRATGVTPTGEESPRSLKQIVLRYLPYSNELHHRAEETPDDVEPKSTKPQKRDAAPTAVDRSHWDVAMNAVWDALVFADTPVSVTWLQQVLETNGVEAMSTTKIQARLDNLVAQELVGKVMKDSGVGRPGFLYALKSRIE